ncbi:type VI secretion system contractile sheath large subunit [Myxococcota bacterium]|nr:type VI secretion system contractile sheath large subunit [Myxococcota bacterium]
MSTSESQTIFATAKTLELDPELVTHPLVRTGPPAAGSWTTEDTVTGLSLILQQALQENEGAPRVTVEMLDQMIDLVDQRLTVQLDEVLHDPTFQAAESAWRGLRFLVDRTKFDGQNKNIIAVLDATKKELQDDFFDGTGARSKKLYKAVFQEEFAQFGGEPIGAILGNYTFGPSTPDVALMEKIADVAELAHAPFIAAAGPAFWGKDTYTDLPKLATLEIKDQPRWQAFRESRNSNYVGLTMPRFLLRHPYDPVENPIRSFRYRERVEASHEHYLWGNAAYAFGTRLTESFSNYGWCPYIIGPQAGGTVPRLPVHMYESMGDKEAKPPTEILIPMTTLTELSNEGFIPLVHRKGAADAVFFYANSVQKAKFFGDTPEGRTAETNYKLGTQLPYMFLVCRLAHHISVFQREQLGRNMTKQVMQKNLQTWVAQYISEMAEPDAHVQGQRPFRAIKIMVNDVPGDPGWYNVSMMLMPHIKFQGAFFELSLVGNIEPK